MPRPLRWPGRPGGVRDGPPCTATWATCTSNPANSRPRPRNRQALAIATQTGWTVVEAANLDNLAAVYWELGRLDDAAEHSVRALDILRQTGSRFAEAVDLTNLGEVRHAQGRLDDALDDLERALPLHREVGNRRGEAETLRLLTGTCTTAPPTSCTTSWLTCPDAAARARTPTRPARCICSSRPVGRQEDGMRTGGAGTRPSSGPKVLCSRVFLSSVKAGVAVPHRAATGYRILADTAMAAHFAFLAYVVAGGFLAWRWPRAIWPHAILSGWGLSTVVCHLNCPLTHVEDVARRRVGQPGLPDGFINHYLTGVVYPDRHARLVLALAAATVTASWTGALLRNRERPYTAGPGEGPTGRIRPAPY